MPPPDDHRESAIQTADRVFNHLLHGTGLPEKMGGARYHLEFSTRQERERMQIEGKHRWIPASYQEKHGNMDSGQFLQGEIRTSSPRNDRKNLPWME